MTDEDINDLTRRMERIARDADEGSSEEGEKKEAQEKREKACGIAPKEGGNLTCPREFKSIADEDKAWGDWTNYKFPMPDRSHADDAASRWGDEDTRKGYTSEEQDIITERIEDRQKSFGESDDDKKGDDSDKRSADELDPYTAPVTPNVDPAAAEGRSLSDMERGLGYAERDGTEAETQAATQTAEPATATEETSDADPATPGTPDDAETRAADAGDAAGAAGAAGATGDATDDSAGLFLRAVESAIATVTRSGSEFSAANAGHLVAAHDSLAHALNMRCCGMDGCDGHSGDKDYSGRSKDDSGDEPGDQDGDGSDDGEGNGEAASQRSALADLHADVAAARSMRADLIAELRQLTAERDELNRQKAAAEEAIRTADEIGLGRPTMRGAGTTPASQKTANDLTDAEIVHLSRDEALAIYAEREARAKAAADAL